MATNKEWLFSLPLEEQYAWMNAEHTESPTSETMQHIGQVIEDTVMRGVYGDTAAENADSRELILTDLEKKTREWHDYDGNFMRIYSDVAYAQIKELLDRQAAITEREATNRYELFCEMCEGETEIQIDELQAQVDELQAITDERWNKYIAEHLRADTLAADLLRANNERDELRGKMEAEHSLRLHWKARAEELTAERDSLQAKCDRVILALNKAAGKWAKADAKLRSDAE